MISSESSLKKTMSADETTLVDDTDVTAGRKDAGRRILVHGVLVQISGRGVLMTGDSGIGKTGCGLDLVALGGLWIADDVAVLERRGDSLYGRGHERTKNLIAVRDRGVLNAQAFLGIEALREETQIHFIIQFIRYALTEGAVQGCEGPSFLEIEGILLPCWRTVAAGCPRQMADQVIGLVKEYLVWEKQRQPAEVTQDEADASGHHYGIVRFR